MTLLRLTLLPLLCLFLASATTASQDPGQIRSDRIGPDFDQNGIRDDVDDFLASRALLDAHDKVLHYLAVKMQRIQSVDTLNHGIARNLINSISPVFSCALATDDSGDFTRTLQELEGLMTNTFYRRVRHRIFNSMLSGSTFSLPTQWECTQVIMPTLMTMDDPRTMSF